MRRVACFARGLAILIVGVLAVRPAEAGVVARNIIICIADGGGFNAYNAASYYEYGRLGCQPYEQAGWIKLASRTISYDQLALSNSSSSSNYGGSTVVMGSNGSTSSGAKDIFDPPTAWDSRIEGSITGSLASGIPFKGYKILKERPTDSAAAATAMASGAKVYNGRVNYFPDSMDNETPGFGRSISEIAKASGRSAGVVTTVQWNDATPACFGGAHSLGRGSRRDIANEMLTSSTLDVIMGAGHPEYDRYGAPKRPSAEADYDIAGGSLTWDLIRSGRHARNWKLVESRSDFEALIARPPLNRPVFGLARVLGATQHERPTRDWNGDGKVDAADVRVAPPFKDPFLTTTPSLPTMARGAISILSQNPKGFFLLVEGGAVDHAGHTNQPGRIIEEQMEFNHTVRAIIDWVNRNSSWDETLVIVSADHETGLVWGVNSDTVAFDPIRNRGVQNAPALGFNTGNHSNSLVPLRARGAGAAAFTRRIIGADPVWGQYVENTSIFEIMRAALDGSSVSQAQLGGQGSHAGDSGYSSSSSAGDGMMDAPSETPAPKANTSSSAKKPRAKKTSSGSKSGSSSGTGSNSNSSGTGTGANKELLKSKEE